MEDAGPKQRSTKEMRLRYAGTCGGCDHQLPVGTLATYDRVTKSVTCQDCSRHDSGDLENPSAQSLSPGIEADELPGSVLTSDPPLAIDSGQVGASARREHQRRRDKREAKIREAHPRLGGLILALSTEPQSTTAWATGAVGEERLGARLNSLISPTIRVLHDRRIPRTKANIDHIVVCPSGVLVIDAKRYKGRPQLRIEGGILRPRVETLIVGRRNCDKVVDGVIKQVELVRAALVETTSAQTAISVRGMLCFVEADWPLIGGAFNTRGVEVLWPKRAAGQIQGAGSLTVDDIESIHRSLASAFPPA